MILDNEGMRHRNGGATKASNGVGEDDSNVPLAINETTIVMEHKVGKRVTVVFCGHF